MARAERAAGGTAGRLAARRRDTSRDGRTPARGTPAPTSRLERGKAAKGGKAALGGKKRKGDASGFKRGVRLAFLIVVMAVIGFFAVLVVDVSASLVGKVHLGETTLAGLWDKVVDRVLDRDVPRLPDPPAKKSTPGPRTGSSARPLTPLSPTQRAPLPAVRPEEDARHLGSPPRAEPRSDPQVEHAQKRLDELLKRL